MPDLICVSRETHCQVNHALEKNVMTKLSPTGLEGKPFGSNKFFMFFFAARNNASKSLLIPVINDKQCAELELSFPSRIVKIL